MQKAERKIYFFILCSIIGILLALVFNRTIIVDEMEHLRMSWLVSQGEVPYRDFFEHHHPLLWYLFAPIIAILPHNILLIFYTAKTLSFSVVCITYYIIYLIIKRFLGGASLTPYFFAILFTFYPIWYGTSLFKPDIFARLFYFSGLYFFFNYLKTQKLKNLIFCVANFTIAFLFLQTIIFSALPLIIPLGFYLYKNPQCIIDCLKASIFPLIVLGGCVALLVYTNIWQEYYQLNWLLNKRVPALTRGYPLEIWEQIVPITTAIIVLIWRAKEKQLSLYEKIIGLLFFTELAQRIYIPAIYAYYLILLLIFIALVIAPVIKKIFTNKKYKQIRIGIYIFLTTMLCMNFITLYLKNNQMMLSVFEKINADETQAVMYITSNYIPVYTKKISYYGVHNTIHKLDDFLFHRFPEFNINEIIRTEKPKYIIYDEESEKEKRKTERFTLKPEMLADYQEIVPYVWQRKETIEK